MATLRTDIGATDRLLRIDSPGAAAKGMRFRLGDDDEILELVDFDLYAHRAGKREPGTDNTRWIVNRGTGGSVAASHSAGAAITAVTSAAVASDTLTPPAPIVAPGGGGLPTGWTQVDPTHVSTEGGFLGGLPEPAADGDAATKGYVDDAVEGVGGGAGAVRIVGPCTITYDDFALNADTNGYARIATIAAGDMVTAIYFVVREAFNDGGSVTGAFVTVGNTDGPLVPGSSLGNGLFDLTSVQGGDNMTPPGVFGSPDLGWPRYRTRTGANPVFADPESLVSTMPWISAGADLFLTIGGFADDGTEGEADVYLAVATPVAP